MARSRISRAKKKKLTTILICVLVIGIAFGAAYFFSIRQIKNNYEIKNRALEEQYNAVQKLAYTAKTDIPAGSAVTEDNVSLVTISSSMDKNLYISKDDLGKIAVVDITAGQAVNKNMIGSDLVSSLRECQYALFTLNSNLKIDDFVDVRIMYPNGENYTVLPKKCVKGINHETNDIYFWLDEADIMDISSAIVDVYMHEGTILYTTKYIEDGQNALEKTYQPSEDVMAAIANDPNIVEEAVSRLNASMREAIESRLSAAEGDNATTKKVDLSGVISSGQDTSNNDENESTPDSSSDNSDTTQSDYVDSTSNVYTDDSNPINDDGGNDYAY